MAELEEPELYSEARYMAAVSVLDYQGSATAHEINCSAHTQISLEEELEVLEKFGIVKQEDNEYRLRSWFEEDAEAIGELVQIDYNGEWRDIDLSENEKEDLAEDGAEIVYWLT
ncbi:hypothetical protein [Candidatus Nanohalovita haloferacivicina]|uniref:hypothetical protein n=1 Tax=Candidatus Nanohalovita haloferacivicina TaxID=2978046 RepID=UPI00325FD6FB|nr:hypothetical protein HBNXNv_0105 [Candidatus Nanohalobia archaeon BNXNv]